MEISVLMAVYRHDNPQYLQESLDSLLRQTLMPAEIVLVIDGPIPPPLEAVIHQYQRTRSLFHIIRKASNEGLGKALKLGLPHCRYSLVARMDADDISHPQRFEKQHEILAKNPGIDLVGSWIDEFDGRPDQVIGRRKVPQQMSDIIPFAKRRSPFNHPTVMFRKESILAIGSYEPLGTFEDYLLWAKFIMAGKIGYNLPESLLYFRTDHELYRRRGGFRKTKDEIRLQNRFFSMGFIGFGGYLRNVIVRGLFRAIPVRMRGLAYRKFLK